MEGGGGKMICLYLLGDKMCRHHCILVTKRAATVPHRDLHGHTKEPYFRGITLHRKSIAQTEHPTMQYNILATYQRTRISCIHVGSTGHLAA